MHSAEKVFFDRIAKAYPTLSAKKKGVANFILADYKKISLMTAKELAVQCEVSEPTIIRFAVNLGFSGYLELSRHVKNMIQMELSSVDRLINASGQPDNKTTLENYCENALQNIKNMMTSVSAEELQVTAETIYKARRVYIVGYRAAAVSANYFGYFLKKIRDNVTIDTTLSWEINDSIACNSEQSIIFAIAFRRYTTKIIKFLDYAKKNKVKIIGLTDSLMSPIINLSDQYTVIDLKGISFVDPLSHVMTYLGALIHEITFIDTQKAMESLEKFEKSAKNQHEFIISDSASVWMPPSNNLKNSKKGE